MSSSRERIIQTARRLLEERGTGVTMAEVARESGVSRQMVYLHFENRAGLFVAITRHVDEHGPFLQSTVDAAGMEPVAGLEHVMRAWIAYTPTILPVARQLQAAALAGADGGEAWDTRMDELWRAFRYAVRRVGPRSPWTVATAADLVWSRTHVTVYDQLVVQRGWEPGAFADHVVDATLTELLGQR